MIELKRINTTSLILSLGFGSVLIFMLVAVSAGHYLVSDVVQSQDEIVRVHNAKNDRVLKMITYAQNRFLNVSRMMHTDDIFEVEELKMERVEAGGYFVANLLRLEEFTLTKQEIQLLDELKKRIKTSYNLINQVVNQVENDNREKALKMFDEQGILSQELVYKTLREFSNLQEKYVSSALEKTQTLKHQYEVTQYTMTSLLSLIGIILAFYVIRRITATEKQLSNERKQALITLGHISDTVIKIGTSKTIEYINPAGERLLDFSSQNVIGKQLRDILQLFDHSGQQIVLKCDTVNCGLMGRNADLRLRTLDGRDCLIELEISEIVREDDSVFLGYVVTIADVTHERSATKALEYQANTDLLTGLSNRSSFEKSLNSFVIDAVNGGTHCVCFMDLDRFKIVNDTCGHIAGDELLRQIGSLIKLHTRKADTLARLGGDEFALILENCNTSEAQRFAEELINVITNFRFVWEAEIFSVGISIGITPINSEKSTTVEDVIKEADSACYGAKNKGRNTCYIYNSEDSVIAQRSGEMNWSNRIVYALEQDKFVLYGQKIVPLAQCEESYEYLIEILIRYIDNGVLIGPNSFIPAAERYHLMPQIDRYVVNKLFTNLSTWPSLLLEKIQICINLSGQTLSDPRFCEFISNKIKEHDVKPGLICFEITETAAIANLSEATEFIHNLKLLGCKFSLDDFGSGLSSFTYLQSLPVDYLKIDGELVKRATENSVQWHMVESIHKIGQMMGVQSVAEYVENDAILSTVDKIGIHYGQGFHLAKPQALDELLLSDQGSGDQFKSASNQ